MEGRKMGKDGVGVGTEKPAHARRHVTNIISDATQWDKIDGVAQGQEQKTANDASVQCSKCEFLLNKLLARRPYHFCGFHFWFQE